MGAGPTLDLINISDDLAALALRGMLKYWGVRVGLHHVATASGMIELLDSSMPLAPHVVLMCHGAAAPRCRRWPRRSRPPTPTPMR